MLGSSSPNQNLLSCLRVLPLFQSKRSSSPPKKNGMKNWCLYQMDLICIGWSGTIWMPHWPAASRLMFLCSESEGVLQPWIRSGTTIRLGTQPTGRRCSMPATTPSCCWFSSVCSPLTCLSTPSANCWGLNLLFSWCFSCESNFLSVSAGQQ